jgi:hypothetical protein
MKKGFYRLPSSRSFAKLFSILAVAFTAFVAAELFFVQQALAAGNLCCKINAPGCPSGTGATGIVLAGDHYCEGSTACNSTSYRFERTSTLAKKVCYSSVTPPSDSTSFTLSGPLTVCQFWRPDLPEEVQVSVASSALGDPTLPSGPTGPYVFNISGMAVCGIADEVDQNYAFFDVDLTIGCVTRTASGNVITYSQLFSDLNSQTTNCPDGSEPVSGTLKGKADPPPVGDITPPTATTPGSPLWRMLTYCQGGIPEVTPAPGGITSCVLNSGIDDVMKSFFEKKVCPKAPPTRPVNGQMFGMTEIFTSGGEFRAGNYGVCSCQGDLNGGDPTCGQGNTTDPITTNAKAAIECEFDWQNAVAGDAIDLHGKNSVNAFIYDDTALGGVCNVNEIVKSSLRACGGNVTPTQIKTATSGNRFGLSMRISESACAADLSNLVVGQTRLINITGTFNDLTGLVGADDVIVVCSGSNCPPAQ